MMMTKTDRLFAYTLALVAGSIMGFWGCVVSAHDDHIVTVGECMIKTERELDMTPQEAWMECERNLR